jgi:cellulose synthase/poly-beta-1,6-N-acetylglucosamine synthase-like glycosyltransferase
MIGLQVIHRPVADVISANELPRISYRALSRAAETPESIETPTPPPAAAARSAAGPERRWERAEILAEPSSVSVVIPAYNEAAVISEVVTSLASAGPWHEIIVVDDGSTDGTCTRATSAGATVVRHPYNKGNGAAVKSGIRTSTGEYVLIVDGDGQHPGEDAVRLTERLGEYDLVIGARSVSAATQLWRSETRPPTVSPAI